MNKMKKKRICALFMAFMCCLSLLAACGKHVKTATTYYSMVTVYPNYNFYRLEANGNFYNNRGMKGTYELKDGVVTFDDEAGGKSEGYIEGDYLFYFAYDKGKDKIPDENLFNAKVNDTHTNISFNDDGSFNVVIKDADPTEASEWKGSYVREGNIITCSMIMKEGDTFTQVYGVRDGLLYNAYCSDESLFDADIIATIEEAEKKAKEQETGVLGVILIVVIMLAVLALVIFIIIFSQKKKMSEMEDKSKK